MSPAGPPGLRPATVADADAVAALLRAAFPDNPKGDSGLLRRQYWADPWGAPASWVVEEGGEVVAHYTVFPVPGVVDGEAVTLGKGADAAVAAAHRGRGLFVAVARAAFADAGRRGWPYTLNHPNESSFRGFTQAGAVEVPGLAVRVRPLSPAWLGERLRIDPRAAGMVCRRWPRRSPRPAVEVAVDPSGAPPDGLDDLWARVLPAQRTGVARGSAWWRWRYALRPDVGYRVASARQGHGELVGVALARPRDERGGRFLAVLELLADDGGVASALMEGLARSEPDAAGLATVARQGSTLASLAAAGGLRRLPRRLQPRPVRFCVVDNRAVAEGRPTDPATARRGWAFAWGDLDHL